MRPTWRHPPRLIAHRGASADAPENTLRAFRQAVIEGARAIEFDVRLTSDDEVVVFHDASLGRTIPGQGFVEETPAAVIRAADAGAWFGPNFAGERVPTLDEVLDAMPVDVLLDVELKADAMNATKLPERVHDIIAGAGALDRALVTSFDGGLASEYAERARRPAGLILAFPPEEADVLEWPLLTTMCVAEDSLDKNTVAMLLERGRTVLAWTVNDSARAEALWEMGVAGVITDRWASLARARLPDAAGPKPDRASRS